MSVQSLHRLSWVDSMRGFCIMAILLDHTEIYYAGSNLIPYSMYVSNVLVLFFFLSGYLFHKHQPYERTLVKHKAYAIARTVLLPYFIFTTLIALPKLMVHGEDIHLSQVVSSIITGQASWFVAALTMAELLFLIILWLTKGQPMLVLMLSLAGFVASVSFPQQRVYPWQLPNALQALLWIGTGYLYHAYEAKIDRAVNIRIVCIALACFAAVKATVYLSASASIINPVFITSYPLFLTDMFLGMLLAVSLFKHLPKSFILEWTGRHSLVYYFFCGGSPLMATLLLQILGLPYSGCYLEVAAAFVITYLIDTAITWSVYRFIPWTTGRD